MKLHELFGGDGGNRNRVRKPLATTFYERILSFKSPAASRRKAGLKLWQPLSHDSLRGMGLFTFTANRRSYPNRSTFGKNGRLIRQPVKKRFCRLFLKVADFIAVPHRCSLIMVQNPRRNPFIPMLFKENGRGVNPCAP